MAAFLFRCPNTGLHVQGWVADDGSEDAGGETYEGVLLGLHQLHMVNPRTDKVLGAPTEIECDPRPEAPIMRSQNEPLIADRIARESPALGFKRSLKANVLV